jgi:hypothetical protein
MKRTSSPLIPGQKVRVSREGHFCLGQVEQTPVDGHVVVRFFRGPGHDWPESVPIEHVTLAQLSSQQRGWVMKNDIARYFRIVVQLDARLPPLRRFRAAFPNGVAEDLQEDAFHVHCDCEPIDPFDNLLARGMETPFFFDRRTRFVQALIEQRTACRELMIRKLLTVAFGGNGTIVPGR